MKEKINILLACLSNHSYFDEDTVNFLIDNVDEKDFFTPLPSLNVSCLSSFNFYFFHTTQNIPINLNGFCVLLLISEVCNLPGHKIVKELLEKLDAKKDFYNTFFSLEDEFFNYNDFLYFFKACTGMTKRDYDFSIKTFNLIFNTYEQKLHNVDKEITLKGIIDNKIELKDDFNEKARFFNIFNTASNDLKLKYYKDFFNLYLTKELAEEFMYEESWSIFDFCFANNIKIDCDLKKFSTDSLLANIIVENKVELNEFFDLQDFMNVLKHCKESKNKMLHMFLNNEKNISFFNLANLKGFFSILLEINDDAVLVDKNSKIYFKIQDFLNKKPSIAYEEIRKSSKNFSDKNYCKWIFKYDLTELMKFSYDNDFKSLYEIMKFEEEFKATKKSIKTKI